MNPLILEQSHRQEEQITDVFAELASNRILFINGEITDSLATDICATLLLKDAENKNEKISIFINSNGGHIRDVFTIFDSINMISAPVETICMGACTGPATLLLVAGSPGMRFATTNSIISFSQLEYEEYTMSDLTDATSLLERLKRDNENMMQYFAKCVKKNIKTVLKTFEKGCYFDAKEALAYGIIDKVIGKSK